MKSICYIATAIILTLQFCACSRCSRRGNAVFSPNGYKSKVVSVIDGRTIELKNGLKVELIGVKGSELSKEYLQKHVMGKNVVLIRDQRSDTPKESYRGMPKKIKSYVRIDGELESVNGKLLSMGLCRLNLSNCKDSADQFSLYVNAENPNHKYGDDELLTKIKPATFQIRHSDGSLGTGFFINETGMAVTNNHVLSLESMSNAVCIFFGEDGQLDYNNYRNIDRILLTLADSKIDFTVFQVKLDPGEKVPYIPLVRKKQNDGIRVAKLGCPVGVNCNYQFGTLSNYNKLVDDFGNEYYYLTHSCGSNNGDSGGPVVNFYAEAVGINQSIQFNQYLSSITGSAQKAEGIAYAVDALTIRRLLKENGIEYDK